MYQLRALDLARAIYMTRTDRKLNLFFDRDDGIIERFSIWFFTLFLTVLVPCYQNSVIFAFSPTVFSKIPSGP